MGIYARETGEGMVFSESDLGPEPPKGPSTSNEDGGGSSTGTGTSKPRPQLKVVK
jgi:stringent starvation protein B